MSGMYFSRAHLDPAGLSATEARTLGNDPYQQHRWIWRLFEEDPKAKRDFLYRVEQAQGNRSGVTVYLVSRRKPDNPAPWRVEAKQYAPRLKAGNRLAFQVRVNPVIKHRIRNDGEPGSNRDRAKTRHRREDVVQAARKVLEVKEAGQPRQTDLIQQAGSDWLLKRTWAFGFSVAPEWVLAEGYQHFNTWQRNRKGDNHKIGLSTLELSGVLEVRDPELFTEKALFQGIGPAKGFGCGLMLVRPVD